MLLVGVRLQRRQSGARRLVIAGYLALIFLAAIGWTGLSAISTRFAALDTGRPALWRDALVVVRRFPLTGTGLNTYTAVTPFFKARPAHASSDEAHNDYLQLAAEGGVLVAAPTIWLIVVFSREVRRRFRLDGADGGSDWIRVGAVTGLIAMALQELVEFSLQMPGNAVLFVVLCAIAAHRPSEPRA
jgi:O-antigen ligase